MPDTPWNAYEVAAVVTGATASVAGVIVGHPWQHSPTHKYIAYGLGLTGTLLLLGTVTERTVRGYMAENKIAAFEENPLRQQAERGDKLWRLQSLNGRTIVEGYATTPEAKMTIDTLVRRWGQSMCLVDARGRVVETVRAATQNPAGLTRPTRVSTAAPMQPGKMPPWFLQGWPSVEVRVRRGPGLWESSADTFHIEAMRRDDEGKLHWLMLQGTKGSGRDPVMNAITDQGEALEIATEQAKRLAAMMPGNPHPVRVLDERGRLMRTVVPPPHESSASEAALVEARRYQYKPDPRVLDDWTIIIEPRRPWAPSAGWIWKVKGPVVFLGGKAYGTGQVYASPFRALSDAKAYIDRMYGVIGPNVVSVQLSAPPRAATSRRQAPTSGPRLRENPAHWHGLHPGQTLLYQGRDWQVLQVLKAKGRRLVKLRRFEDARGRPVADWPSGRGRVVVSYLPVEQAVELPRMARMEDG